MNNRQTEFILKNLDVARKNKENLLIVLVMNVKGITKTFNDYEQSSVTSEYYSYRQYEEILDAIKSLGYCVKCYFDEDDFISDFEMGIIRDNYPHKILVINSAQKGIGPGRKSLIPAFCQLHNILCSSSNPYTVNFARNKYHWHCFLKELGFPVCSSWYYGEKLGWLSGKTPPLGTKVIIKLNNESSSIGLTTENIIVYSPESDIYIKQMCHKFKQDVIIEQFVSGFEVEVPVLISSSGCCSLCPAGISVLNEVLLADTILDYDIRGNHKFEHYEFITFNPNISKKLEKVAEDVTLVMGIKNIGRVDFRIDLEDNFYITDIATNPHITKSMTFNFDFNNLGFKYENVLEVLIGLSLTWSKDD